MTSILQQQTSVAAQTTTYANVCCKLGILHNQEPILTMCIGILANVIRACASESCRNSSSTRVEPRIHTSHVLDCNNISTTRSDSSLRQPEPKSHTTNLATHSGCTQHIRARGWQWRDTCFELSLRESLAQYCNNLHYSRRYKQGGHRH